MSGADARPVIVGVAQIDQRCEDPRESCEPLTLMERALRAAAEDAESRALLERASALYVIRGVWPYKSPGAALRSRIGASGAALWTTPFGGNYVQAAILHAAQRIARGQVEIALLTGAENGHSQARAHKLGMSLSYSECVGERAERIAPEKPMVGEPERARGIGQPIQVYPIFESALRYARGESIDAHRARIAELWSRFSAVAAANPHAWLRKPYTPHEIATPSPDNRMIGFPYTKLLNSNNAVDQGAAVMLCSAAVAHRLGIPRDRWIHLHAGTEGRDTDFVSERWDLRSSPAIRIAGRRALELAGKSIDQIQHLDLYSCFPSAVQVAMAELAIPADRALTVTGGLTFAGGPLNDYVMHAVATMANVLRSNPGQFGLVTANGGFLTKHAFGVYSSEPAERFAYEDVQREIDALPRRRAPVNANGSAEIEGYTVLYDREGPRIAHAACLLPDGTRTWANSTDPQLLQAMTRDEHCGTRVVLDGAGTLRPI